MKPASLIAATLVMMLTSWLSLTYAYRNKSVAAPRPSIANFNVYINDEEGRPVENYAVRLDGRPIGKTNRAGTLSKANIAIGNTQTVNVNVKSSEFHYDTPREALLELPEYPSTEAPHFTINVILCFDFVVCEEDRFNIALSPPIKSKTEEHSRQAGDLLTTNAYNFKLVRTADQGPKISTIISEIERMQKNRKTPTDGTPVNVLFSYLNSDEHGQMLRVVGQKEDSTHNEFALLLPFKPQLRDLAKEVSAYLADLSPKKSLASSRKTLKMKFQQPLSSNYEVYAGGFSGEPITPDSWNLAVPASGKFFLTIVKKGEIITRKFFDTGDAEQIEYDAK